MKYLGLFSDTNVKSELKYKGYKRIPYDENKDNYFAECEGGGGTVAFIGISKSPDRGAPVERFANCNPFIYVSNKVTPVITGIE